MSYVPFTPDVRPPPPDQAKPPRTYRLRWIFGTLGYFMLMALWLRWMTLPPELRPPLATIPLPDGTELRLIHAARGVEFSAANNATFGNRLRLRDPNIHGHATFSGEPGAAWLVFTRFDPRTKRFSPPGIDAFTILESSPAFAYRGTVLRVERAGSEHPVQIIYLPVTSARPPAWNVELNRRSSVTTTTLRNPFFSSAISEFSPKPLPQKTPLIGGTMELERVSFRQREVMQSWVKSSEGPFGSGSLVREPTYAPGLSLDPVIRIESGGLRENAFELSYRWFDPTGNSVVGGVLPFSEPAWGLRVRAVQHTASSLEAGSMVFLGEMIVPAPGGMVPMTVPPDLRAEGVTDLILVGKGHYAVDRGKLFATDAPEAAPKLTLGNRLTSLRELVNAPSLLVISRPRSGTDVLGSPLLLGQQGEAFFQCPLHSTTSTNLFYFRRHGFDTPTSTGLIPGTKVKVLISKPKVLEGMFLFPPLEPPVAK